MPQMGAMLLANYSSEILGLHLAKLRNSSLKSHRLLGNDQAIGLIWYLSDKASAV